MATTSPGRTPACHEVGGGGVRRRDPLAERASPVTVDVGLTVAELVGRRLSIASSTVVKRPRNGVRDAADVIPGPQHHVRAHPVDVGWSEAGVGTSARHGEATRA